MEENKTSPELENTELVGTKKALDSTTIRGGIVSIAASIGTILAITLGQPDLAVAIPSVAGAAVAIWGSVVSIIGRVRATEKIAPSTPKLTE